MSNLMALAAVVLIVVCAGGLWGRFGAGLVAGLVLLGMAYAAHTQEEAQRPPEG